MKVAIVGAGKLGLKVAEALIVGDCEITLIDKNSTVLDKISQRLDVMALEGDGVRIDLLKQNKISTYDFLLACTDSDEKNILISSFAKSLGCQRVIARVRDPEHMNQLDFIKESMGIDYIVNPDLAITVEIYKYLVEKYTLSNGIFTSGKSSLIEFKAKKMSKIIGVSMNDIGNILPNMLVVAISRNGKVIIPHGDTVIEPNDGVYLIGEKNAIIRLNQKVHERGKYTNIQKVMIIGGGKTGFYLARKLADFGASVKLVENDKTRCHYLSTQLNNVMVLHGDGTDQNLLDEENFEEMDAFITATGFDEENLLLALMAKRAGIEDVISKVSRKSYQTLIESLGIDMALNPLDISTSNILRFIQGNKRVVSSVLIQGQAEIMEIVADSSMNLTNIPLSNLKLPNGVIIATIHRGNELIIPKGDTKILDGDKVIIFCLLSELSDIEKLFKKNKLSIF